MKTQELIEYLSKYPLNSEVSVVIANVEGRVKHEIIHEIAITDCDHPVLCYDIDSGTSFDEEEIRCAEECERE